MSFPKKGKSFPKKGKSFPNGDAGSDFSLDDHAFALKIALALKSELKGLATKQMTLPCFKRPVLSKTLR
jgi:hypothetical protein